MKRFKNILVVYDLVPGSDDTLQRAVELAVRNDAHLTIVHAVNPLSNERQVVAERERILDRIVASLVLPGTRRSHLVRPGPPTERILELARDIRADLIVAPDVSTGFYSQFLGLDTPTELLRRAECPVWIVRPQQENRYQRIVAAVDAGKPDAFDCPANRRILEIGASLAVLERAQLHVVYAWDFVGAERDTMASELPRGKYEELFELAHLKNLGHVVTLTHHVMGSSLKFTPAPVRGHPCKVITDYVEDQNADLLVIDGKLEGAFKSALMENTATQLLRQSTCSVLFTRPTKLLQHAQLPEAA